jgi:membrane protease YdiL (CAAX protease family)
MDHASIQQVPDTNHAKITRTLIAGALIPVVYLVGLTAFALGAPATLVPPNGWIALHALAVTLFIVCPLVAVRLPLQETWRTIGGQRVPWIDMAIAVLAGLLLTFVFEQVYNVVVYALWRVTPDFGYTQSVQDVLPFIVWVIILGPLGEELFFRGYYGYILKKPWQFLLVSSALWAALHGDPVGFLPFLWTGLVFGYMRIRFKSFYPSLALHIIMNILALVFYFWLR